jgi:pimeloyl-ACP methyl ester carboxylesterase
VSVTESSGTATAPDGVRLAWWSSGPQDGSGEPLLLLNGQGADHHAWDRVGPLLAVRHRLISFDTRGTGASEAPTGTPYTTRGLVADALAVLDAAGRARAHVFGYSMGGRIAQWLAVDHPERVGALVLGATSPGDAHGVAREPDVNELMTAPMSPRVAKRWGDLMYSRRYLVRALLHRDLYQPPELSQAVRDLHFAASQGHDAWGRLADIAAPTLVLHGAADRLNPTANAVLMVEQITGAELHLVEGGRHGFYDEFRDETARVVLDFLARHPL